MGSWEPRPKSAQPRAWCGGPSPAFLQAHGSCQPALQSQLTWCSSGPWGLLHACVHINSCKLTLEYLSLKKDSKTTLGMQLSGRALASLCKVLNSILSTSLRERQQGAWGIGAFITTFLRLRNSRIPVGNRLEVSKEQSSILPRNSASSYWPGRELKSVLPSYWRANLEPPAQHSALSS